MESAWDPDLNGAEQAPEPCVGRKNRGVEVGPAGLVVFDKDKGFRRRLAVPGRARGYNMIIVAILHRQARVIRRCACN